MHLEELEVTGFKSFASKTIFRFGPGMTAIIGPNGSGKSNLAEAVRWVLGEQSLKNLRGRKATDVIFAGSKTRPRNSYARVALTFNNESERFPVAASEVRLTRTLNRSGESEYAINGDTVRLLDIQQLLAEAGLGAKSYAVISQGTVDRYLVANPAARRELFDEACGIKALQIKLNQTERRLEQARQKQEELDLVIRELEPRVRVLKRQAQQQAEKERLQIIFNEKQAIWLQREWQARDRALNQVRSQCEEMRGRVQNARTNRQSAEGTVFQTLNQVSQGGMSDEAKLILKKQELQHAQENQGQILSRKIIELALDKCDLVLDKIENRGKVNRGEIAAARQAITRVRAGWKTRVDPDEIERLKREIKVLEQAEPIQSDYDVLEETLNEAREQELSAERDMSAMEAAIQTAEEDLEEIVGEIRRERGTQFLQDIQQEKIELTGDVTEEEIRQMAVKLARLGEIDPIAQKEYEETKVRYDNLWQQKQDTETAWRNTRRLAGQIRREINDRFKVQFQTIQKEFKQYFEQLFGGGTARLELVEESVGEDEEEEHRVAGIEIFAQPPGKKIQSVQLLSGGEKALTSLAMLLAIVKIQQPPFLVLDEVDAALDEANSWRFAEATGVISQTTQCIVVTHNREVMGEADVLYGITMNNDGVSRAYSVRMDEIAETESGDLTKKTV